MASILKIGKKWRALVRRKGHPNRCKTFPVKAQAEAWARHIESSIEVGILVAAPTRITMKELIRDYRELREMARPISDSSNEHYMLKRLTEGLGDRLAGSMAPQELVDYAKMRSEEGAGPYTINMEISKLGTVMRYAGVNLKLPDVVGRSRPLLKHLALIGGGGKRERRPTEDELVRILQTLSQPYSDAVAFSVATAMRRGEITRLLWSDVDEQKKLIMVRDRKDPRKKKGNDQRVPLLGDAWAILQRQPRDDDRVFPIHPQTISKYFLHACEALGIPDLHFHDLRHEGTSRLFEQGYKIQEVALVTGHKDWRHLKRYTNLRPEDIHRP